MKSKRVFIVLLTLVFAFSSFGFIRTQTASAGQDDFILPYYDGYVEDGATIISQDTVIDMSGYNGVKGVGFDAGEITATTEYQIATAQAESTFYLPYAGRLDDLEKISITVNGETVKPKRLYGNMPNYHAGLGVFSCTVQDAISSAKPLTIQEGTGKLYVFATSETPLEYSFKKEATQTVFHSGANWSRTGVDGYSIKYNTNTNAEYPYRLFVSDGELAEFTANVTYTVSDISYQDYVDYYVNDEIGLVGEEYRGVIYSHFNRSLNGQVEDAFDVMYDYSSYVFALLKVPVPFGNASVVVNTIINPLVNGLYNPYIYIIRTISAYPQACAYSLEIKTSEEIPYVIEENIGLSSLKYEGNQQIADGYYIVSAEKKPDYVLKDNASKNKNLIWLYIVCSIVGGIAVGGFVWWIWGVVERRRNK